MSKSAAELARHWFKGAADSLGDAEKAVFEHAVQRAPIARDTYSTYVAGASFGQRTADAIARVGGSWTFIIAFLLFLAVWTLANVFLATADRFDPYPFIFLNLILSMLAAIQAPIIMMSQNRQAERDRLDAAHDYEVNLKAEIEIMALHEKLDEMRHLELLAMRDEIMRIGEKLRSLDGRLPDPAGEAPGAGGGNAGA